MTIKLKITATITVLMMTLSFSALSQRNGRDKVNRIKRLSRSLDRDIQQGSLRDLTRHELREVEDLIVEARDILRGGGGDTRPPRGDNRACAQNRNGQFERTFQVIKNFAYAGNGLDYSSEKARQYAHEWTSTYRCDVAQSFISDMRMLINFSYSGSGLDYSKAKAIIFAIDKVNKQCNRSENPQSEFTRHYNFAYSSGGLDMSKVEAIAYAYEQINRQFFGCRGAYSRR